MSSSSGDPKATILALRRRQRRSSPPSTLAKSSTQAAETANLLAHVRQAITTDVTQGSRSKEDLTPTNLPSTRHKKEKAILKAPQEASKYARTTSGRRTTNDSNTSHKEEEQNKEAEPEEPPPKIIQPIFSSKKRPIAVPIIDTQPPKIIPHRFMPLIAADSCYCLNTTANRLVPHQEALWKIVSTDEVVLYGSSAVRWQNEAGDYLNITARANENKTEPLDISLSTTWDSKDPSTLWTLHEPSQIIPVGPSEGTVQGPPARIAQGFVLRNIEWNGILHNGSLRLLTDAHGQPIVADEDDASHPMTRLWQAHSFVPSVSEVWYAQELPNPVYHDNDDDDAIDQKLFGETAQTVAPQALPTDKATQETILLDELLGACMGLSGDHIKFEDESFQLREGPWDTILQTCIVDLLEIPTSFRLVNAWLLWQRHNECPVRRALYEEMQTWMDEYLQIILLQCQAFRDGTLSIHSLQPLHEARSMMQSMVSVCQLFVNGGALIQRLPRVQRLSDAVIVPYREHLHAWLTQGHLIEMNHFMIQRNAHATCWQERYLVREDHVLTELLPTRQLVQQTLATGRYWNAVRLCQTIPAVPTDMGPSITSFIEIQHENASKALKVLLLPDLKPSLQLIQEYFLMYNADMYLTFLEKASMELGKDIELISRHRVQHFFNEPSIQCYFRLEGSNNYKNVQGVDAFAIRLANLSFPSVILLTKQVMAEYTTLFRHLFKVKYAEQKLLTVWKDHQLTKDLPVMSCLRATFALRHRMLHFIDNLHYYLRCEVVEVQWAQFMKDINKDTNTVDDILEIQRKFLDVVLGACMLKDRKARSSLAKLINTCISFTTQMDNFHDATQLTAHDPSRRRVIAIDSSPPTAKLCRERLEAAQELREQRRDIQTSRIEHEATSESFQNMVTRFSEVFNRRLHDFVSNLSTQHVSLHTRLNFNGFLSSDLV